MKVKEQSDLMPAAVKDWTRETKDDPDQSLCGIEWDIFMIGRYHSVTSDVFHAKFVASLH